MSKRDRSTHTLYVKCVWPQNPAKLVYIYIYIDSIFQLQRMYRRVSRDTFGKHRHTYSWSPVNTTRPWDSHLRWFFSCQTLSVGYNRTFMNGQLFATATFTVPADGLGIHSYFNLCTTATSLQRQLSLTTCPNCQSKLLITANKSMKKKLLL